MTVNPATHANMHRLHTLQNVLVKLSREEGEDTGGLGHQLQVKVRVKVRISNSGIHKGDDD